MELGKRRLVPTQTQINGECGADVDKNRERTKERTGRQFAHFCARVPVYLRVWSKSGLRSGHSAHTPKTANIFSVII